jgi:hypothetical protein
LARCLLACWRCDAVRGGAISTSCQNHGRRHCKSSACKSLFAWYSLLQARTPALCLSSSPPPSAALNSHSTRTHTHTHTPTHPRTRTRTRSARRRTPYSVRSPIPDQEAKLLGVSHARSPPPPSLRSLDRCHPAPALGKHQLEQSSTH